MDSKRLLPVRDWQAAVLDILKNADIDDLALRRFAVALLDTIDDPGTDLFPVCREAAGRLVDGSVTAHEVSELVSRHSGVLAAAATSGLGHGAANAAALLAARSALLTDAREAARRTLDNVLLCDEFRSRRRVMVAFEVAGSNGGGEWPGQS